MTHPNRSSVNFQAIRDEAAAKLADLDPSTPPNLRAALLYLSWGWSAIPCCNRACKGKAPHRKPHPPKSAGKVPFPDWLPFKSKLPSVGQVVGWWKKWPTANVGVVLNKVCGVIGVDIDDQAGETELQALFPDGLAPTLSFSTPGGGRRLLYAWPDDVPYPSTKHKKTAGKKLTFIAGGFTVMPPSVGLIGLPYAWHEYHGGDREPIQITPADLVEYLGGVKGQSRRPCVGATVVPPADDPSHALARARGMAEKHDPAISGQDGSGTTFRLACNLLRIEGLTESQALAVLLDVYNPRCVPPWSVAELLHKVESAKANGRSDPYPERNGTIARQGSEAGDTTHGRLPAEPAAATSPPPRPGLDQVVDEKLPATPKRYGIMAVDHPRVKPTWYLKPWFEVGDLALMIGRGNAGKSHLLPWFLKQAKRPVLFPGFEENAAGRVMDRLEAAGVNMDNLLMMTGFRTSLFHGADEVDNIIRQHQADLVTFDPLDSYVDSLGRENDNPTVRQALENLAEVLHANRCNAIGIRHPGKHDINLVRGAVAYRNVPRVVQEIRWDKPTDRRTIITDKFPGHPWPAPYRFVIEGEKDKTAVARIVGPTDAGVVAAMRETPDETDARALHEARLWLRCVLADGPIDAGTLYSMGRKVEIAKTTLVRAGVADGVDRPEPEKKGRGSLWLWIPPSEWPSLDD